MANFANVDDGALVRAFADLLSFVARFHPEFHPPAIIVGGKIAFDHAARGR